MSTTIQLRSEWPGQCQRLVIKIGSAALAHPETGVDQHKIEQIIHDCFRLLQAGMEVIVVSSGAISIGRRHMPVPADGSIAYLQACSAVGQPLLMRCYTQAFHHHHKQCAQVLLTHEDMRDSKRKLNLKNMMNKMLQAGITPILNENDSVSYAEITVGDNDQLAAMVTEVMEADGLVILTSPDGLYDRDPGLGEAQILHKVAYDEGFGKLNLAGKSSAGRGGMITKLEAVRKLTPLGIPVILATFKKDQPVLAALEGGGTFFEGSPQATQKARHRWLTASARLGAKIKIDRGAGEAVLNNSSLLPSGIHHVEGSFKRGDCVKILCGNRVVALGLVEYSAAELRKIQGRQSQEISRILGYCPSKVAIHKDNLVIREDAP
ncbi:MAG TPA: glutamate 5-kinase [Oligoflexus sp.]|uniref:glutamate 5-kinase n=1 Tax=Oligoflexus sp. TaxID=1971216 RepID=UPI002D276E71|nr:glutamate 5-kinase [Oligoflexus sp.]HYX37359.1 glutamate 5-kinase [Oligoflexus sp.]